MANFNNRLTVNFLTTDPASGQTINFSYYPFFPETGVTNITSFQFTDNVLTDTQILIDTDPTIQADNANSAFNGNSVLPNYFNIEYTGGTSLNLTTVNNSPIFNTARTPSSPSAFTMTLSSVSDVPAVGEIRTRSPFLVKGPSTTAYTDSLWIIKISNGDWNSLSASPVSHVIEKTKLIPSQKINWFDVSELLREEFTGGYDYYMLNNSYTTARQVNSNEGEWVEIYEEHSYLGALYSSGYTFYYANDGLLYPTETQGAALPKLLMDGTQRNTYAGTHNHIYVKRDGLTSAWYNTSTAPTTNVNITLNTDVTNVKSYINAYKVRTDLAVDWIKYNFAYNGLTGSPTSITYYLKDSCKYTNYDVVFKNRYGVLETISMNKKSMKSLTTDSTSFKRSIIDIDGNFDNREHTTKQYNTNGYEEWVLNSDFQPDYMNEVFKQMMLSEEVYVIMDGRMTPVIKLDDSIQFKTELDDKLYQYSLKIKLSHSAVKNIR